MKAKCNYNGLAGMVPMSSSSRLNDSITISGSESLMQRADELYQAGNDQEARETVREALQIALRRLEARHGASSDRSKKQRTSEVVWEAG